MRRIVGLEAIDDPATSSAELECIVRCVRMTNRRLGGIRMLLESLTPWSVRWPKDRPITMLDIGTGAADLPLAAAQWARASGFDLRITAIDSNERVLGMARDLCRDEPSIELLQVDAMTLLDEATSPFPPASFDYVHSGMFLHHLQDPVVPRMLAAMDRLARVGLIWNDLIRTHRGYLVAWLLTIGQPIRHDCLASLRAGFRESEVLALTRQLGLTYARYKERYNWQRFSLTGEKPGAWEEPPPRRPSPVLARVPV